MPNGKNRLGMGNCYFTSDANFINPSVGVPKNVGYQQAFDGKSYLGIGINTFKGINYPVPRNIVGAKLLKPLKTGRKYKCSFNLSPMENSNVALNKFGMLFFTQETSLGIDENENYISQKWPNRAHILSDSILFDTTRWYKIEQEFVADSAYTFVLVGNFFSLDSLSYQQVLFDSTLPAYYSSYSSYYLDGVEVVEVTPRIISDKLIICTNDTVCLKVLNINNTDTFLLNNSIIVPNDSLIQVLENTTTFYLISNNIVLDSLTIVVIDDTQSLLPHDTELCNDLTIELGSLIEADNYLWSTGASTKVLTIYSPNTYWLKANFGDCTLVDSISITSCGSHFYLPNAFSPNGDGINDLIGPVTNRVISYQIKIYDAWGKYVFTIDTLNKNWDGLGFIAGCYPYYGQYIDEQNKINVVKGVITLIK
jgi:gliding motility-associated-like protein